MGIPALLKLKHKDVGALVVFFLIGWLISNTISDPTWAAYTAFLVCDHLFLGWVVFLGDNRVRHPVPIEVIVPIHIAFVFLVIVVVAARDSIHYFSLFPYPMAALALWLLSCAAGYERNRPEPVGLRRARATYRAPVGQRMKKPVWAHPATRSPRPETASRPAQPEPAAPAWVIPEPAIAEPPIEAAQPAPNFVQSGLAEPGPRSSTAIHEVLTVTESPALGYKPTVSGIGLDWPPSANPLRPAPAPELCRDNSIAADLRRTYSEEVARFYPSLVATAEDNEAWLDARGKENPTHRKLGMSVREEYEEWLSARLLARAAQDSPAAASCGDGEGQPQQVQV